MVVLINGFVNGFEVGFIMDMVSENKVSFCSPATPFSEKCVILTGSWDGFRGAERLERGVIGEVRVEMGVRAELRVELNVRLLTPDPRDELGAMGVVSVERSSRLEG